MEIKINKMEQWEKIANEFFSKEFEGYKRNLLSGRRPDGVRFVDIETDARRRDLTINALYYDIDKGEIVDLVGGYHDIKNNIVRTVGNPVDRFSEDRLRIMRVLRFAARMGSELDGDVKKALGIDSSLEGISAERIRDEFIKGIKSAKSVKYFLVLLDQYGIFDWVLRGLKVNRKYIEERDVVLVVSFLLVGNDINLVQRRLNELKYTIDEVRGIVFLLRLLDLSMENAVQLKRMRDKVGLSDEQIREFGVYVGIDKNFHISSFIFFVSHVVYL